MQIKNFQKIVLNFIDCIKENIALYVCIAFYVAFIAISGIGCPILFLTGIPCFGCGMTRALFHLCSLDFEGAFHYHPLCFFMPLFAIIILLRKKMSKKAYCICLYAIIAAFAITYILRLFNPCDEIVKIRISNGLIYKLLIILKERRINLW
jgi:hypothetical protein